MDELKPCPFCGGYVQIAYDGDNVLSYWVVTRGYGKTRCRCRLFMESHSFSQKATPEEKMIYKHKLIDAWNRRADNG